MTPQEKSVFSKLFAKTELASHKVELALVDDVKKLALKYEPIFAKANSDYLSALQGFKEALSVLEQAEEIAKKGQQQVKDLGLNDNFFSNVLTQLADQKKRVLSGINKLK